MKKNWRKIEFIIIFIFFPLLVNFDPQVFPPLLAIGLVLIYILFLYQTKKKLRKKKIFKLHKNHHKMFPEIYNRVLLSLSFIGVFILAYNRYLLFQMVLNEPLWWLTLLFAYPVVSALPQEIIFRSFFFARYKKIFKKNILVFMSASSFSFAHLIFHNWLAIGFTFIGGLYFALTYAKTKSLLLVVIEHSIYGLFLFTIGFGSFLDYEQMKNHVF